MNGLELHCKTLELTTLLSTLLPNPSSNRSFLITIDGFTLAFWRCENHFFVFDSHAVNEFRKFDDCYERNLARLFQCSGFYSLAKSLLQNTLLDGEPRAHCIEEVIFAFPSSSNVQSQLVQDIQVHNTSSEDIFVSSILSGPTFLPPEVIVPVSVATRGRGGRPKKVKRGGFPARALKRTHIDVLFSDSDDEQILPRQIIVEADVHASDTQTEAITDGVESVVIDDDNTSGPPAKRSRFQFGKPIKAKPGRPKTSSTTREEQTREAVRKYFKNNPPAVQGAKDRYTTQNPEIHQESVRIYSQNNPEVNR